MAMGIKRTTITTDKETMKLLKKIAQADRRSASGTIAILIQAEARKRGWLNGKPEAGNTAPVIAN